MGGTTNKINYFLAGTCQTEPFTNIFFLSLFQLKDPTVDSKTVHRNRSSGKFN